ncbi:PREDICTED: uncharacterized protein LOC101619714 isoform X3 [Condylura cristata]|uniref:uncharacterized protein LOC101619714 isoform X3 n=1 Tax=Condylura cristata TaxID=143302 RepID=UPI000643B6B9|nr:PREDICTED: uncharacterized protein LOC101619714 isoform X3 [Condylura cristata]
MVERLCQAFGPRLLQLDGVAYHAFPSLQALAGPEAEAQLRKMGLGYRARYVSASARTILEERGGLAWLQRLSQAPYEEAHRALCTLPGVGAKETFSGACGALTLAGPKRCCSVRTCASPAGPRSRRPSAGGEPKGRRARAGPGKAFLRAVPPRWGASRAASGGLEVWGGLIPETAACGFILFPLLQEGTIK